MTSVAGNLNKLIGLACMLVILVGFTSIAKCQLYHYQIGPDWDMRVKKWGVVGKDTNIPAGGEYVCYFTIESPTSIEGFYIGGDSVNVKVETFFIMLRNARTADRNGLEGPTWMQIVITAEGAQGLLGNEFSSNPQILYLHRSGGSSVLFDLGYLLDTDVKYTLHIKNLGVKGGTSIDAVISSIEYLVVLGP